MEIFFGYHKIGTIRELHALYHFRPCNFFFAFSAPAFISNWCMAFGMEQLKPQCVFLYRRIELNSNIHQAKRNRSFPDSFHRFPLFFLIMRDWGSLRQELATGWFGERAA